MHPEMPPNLAPLLPEMDVDEILRGKRKARAGQRACYPCRQRKVKCSYDVPCRTCVEREHPELCSYHPPAKRVHMASTTSSIVDRQDAEEDPNWKPTKADWNELRSKLDRVEQCLIDLRRNLHTSNGSKKQKAGAFDYVGGSDDSQRSVLSDGPPNESPQGINTNIDLLGENVYLGGNSVPAMVVALGKGGDGGQEVQELLGKSILPVFGLDNDTATYPFVDLWGLPHGSIIRIEQLCALLPSDADCLQYFSYYRDVAHVLYPGITDIAEFESDLTNFLISRGTEEIYSDGNDLATQIVYGKDLHWIGLLFATLASGCQCSGRPRKERQLTSQVYVCGAYECLRIVNYLSHSTLVDIQNLLILGNVISNNMNAGVAWSLLGLTIRLAQSQGLHHEPPASILPVIKIQRSNVWWQIIWQDSLLSITYDRASSAATIDTQITPWDPGSGQMTYAQCMRTLCKTGLEIVHSRQRGSHHELSRILQYREKLQDLLDNASDHLRDTKQCRSMRDQLEHWNLYLHRSYVMSELCRPTIHMRKNPSELSLSLRKTCIESLADTVEAFMGLQNVTQFASQSWAAVHRSLSSALLLAILREPSRNERVRRLLSRLVSVMSTINSGINPSELSAPITRSVQALKKLVDLSTPAPVRSVESLGNSSLDSDVDYFTASTSAQSTSPPFVFGSEESSPYAIMDSILWGDSWTEKDIGFSKTFVGLETGGMNQI